MRRIDAIAIIFGVFLAGGLVYVILQILGLNQLEAGIWSQALLVGGLVGWLVSYVFRAITNNMTYHQQREEYEQAYFNKRLEELTPEELERIQGEIEQEKASKKG